MKSSLATTWQLTSGMVRQLAGGFRCPRAPTCKVRRLAGVQGLDSSNRFRRLRIATRSAVFAERRN